MTLNGPPQVKDSVRNAGFLACFSALTAKHCYEKQFCLLKFDSEKRAALLDIEPQTR